MNRDVIRKVTKTSLQAAMLAGLLSASTAAFAQDPADPPQDWTGSAGLGLSLTRGNSDTINLSVSFDLTHDPKRRNVMKWTAMYLRGTQDGSLTVNRMGFGFRDEFTLSPRTFVFGQVEYLRDTFKLIDYLVAPTGGVGFKIVDTEPTLLAIDIGAGGVWEQNPGVDLRAGGAVTAGEELTHKLSETASIKQAATALFKTDDFSDVLYTFSAGLATRVTERIQLSVELVNVYKTRVPTVDTRKNDVAVVTAIAATF